jgi:ferredoxin
MSVTEKSKFVDFLAQHDQKQWNDILSRILPAAHAVDRMATRIWFGFWPLELTRALEDPAGPDEMARIMDLEGQWHLKEQIDASVEFLYGARYWAEVKKAVLSHADASDQPDGSHLEAQIRLVARTVAEKVNAEESLLLGITAVAFMILQQVGFDALAAVVDTSAVGGRYKKSPDKIVASREKGSGGSLSRLFHGARHPHKVVWDDKLGESFKAMHGEDLASAASRVNRDFLSVDYRRPAGPIPVECRVASCGYCWIGIVSGKENMSELSDHEKERLHYFGYDQVSDPKDTRPPIRLSCQAQCEGDVTVVIPPWNGELKRRLHKTRDKLGTV